MYTGNEKLEFKGNELPYTMLQFWQLSLSDVLFSMNRGTFAEYIVRCALAEGGFVPTDEANGSIRVWDITGPEIPSTAAQARIEVKSAASIQSDTPDEKEPLSLPDAKIVFSIKPAIDWSKEKEGARRNNDLYVFCHYKAERKQQNILDMGLWDFYVYPTFKIENDPKLKGKNSISLYRIKKLGVRPVSFDMVYDEIMNQINLISAYIKCDGDGKVVKDDSVETALNDRKEIMKKLSKSETAKTFAGLAKKYGVLDHSQSDGVHDRFRLGKEGKSKSLFLACSRVGWMCVYMDWNEKVLLENNGFPCESANPDKDNYDYKAHVNADEFDSFLEIVQKHLGRV